MKDEVGARRGARPSLAAPPPPPLPLPLPPGVVLEVPVDDVEEDVALEVNGGRVTVVA